MDGIVERTDFIEEIIAKIEQGTWCGIVGARYSGKTVLANQLAKTITQKHADWKLAHVEFSERKDTLDDVWQQMESAIPLGNAKQRGAGKKDQKPSDRLRSILSNNEHVYCFVLDNIRISPDEVMQQLTKELRNLNAVGDFKQRLKFVIFGGMKLFLLAQGQDAPLSGIIDIMRLPDFTSEQSIAFFEQRLGAGWLDSSAKEAIATESGGHPPVLQSLAEIIETSFHDKGMICGNDIMSASKELQSKFLQRDRPGDDFYSDTICFLERHTRAFNVLLDLLDIKECFELGPDDKAIMCGAFSSENRRLRFKGMFVERTLKAYFDELRKADYCCLHGNWERARMYYTDIAAYQMYERREAGFGHSKKRIMDLCLGLAPVYMNIVELKKAQDIITQTSKDLFGANQAALWRIRRTTQEAEIVSTTSQKDFSGSIEAKDMALAASRENLPFTLVQNKGIIQVIGSERREHDTDRWALELQYENGIAQKQWAIDSLHYVEPLFWNILNQALSREIEIDYSRKLQTLIGEISLELHGSTELDQVLDKIVDAVTNKLNCECAQVSLVFRDHNEIRAVKNNGAYARIEGMQYRRLDGDDILALVCRDPSKKYVNISNCFDPQFHCVIDAIKESGLRSQMIVPLIVENEIIGTLQVGDTEEYMRFSDSDISILRLFAEQAALGIRMAKERETLEAILEAAVDAAVVVNSNNRIEYCSKGYTDIFKRKRGDNAPLTCLDRDPKLSLVYLAYNRGKPMQSLRQFEDRKHIITAVSRKDPFGRYDGGVELISRSKIYGLMSAFSEIRQITDENRLGQALVDYLCNIMGYSRARFYRTNIEKSRLVSFRSSGMPADFAKEFGMGNIQLLRSQFSHPDNSNAGDIFSCMDMGEPLVMVGQSHGEQLEPRKICTDSQHRKVVLIPDEDRKFLNEIGKGEIDEWINIPIEKDVPIGLISVDKKGLSDNRFGHEDIEILALFAKWASDAMSLVLELKKAREKADSAFDVRKMGKETSLEPLIWDFVVNITLRGGLGLNRAVVFLRQPQSEIIGGYVCHGAPNNTEWNNNISSLNPYEDRNALIDQLSLELSEGRLSESEQRRIQSLRNIIIVKNSQKDAFSSALTRGISLQVTNPGAELDDFYDALEWEVPQKALICPLMFRGECEGLVYVDRAFLYQDISDADQTALENYCIHLASILHRYRLDEQLRYLVLGHTHTWSAPFSAIKQIAQILKRRLSNKEDLSFTDLISAEASRGHQMVRRVLQAGKLYSGKLVPSFSDINLVELLRNAIYPYITLMKEDGVNVSVNLPEGPVLYSADAELLGSVFAELAANAQFILSGSHAGSKQIFLVSYMKKLVKGGSVSHVLVFENSGSAIPDDLRARLFEPFSSLAGSRGLGLWYVKGILESHYHSEVEYKVNEQGLSQFVIALESSNEKREV